MGNKIKLLIFRAPVYLSPRGAFGNVSTKDFNVTIKDCVPGAVLLFTERVGVSKVRHLYSKQKIRITWMIICDSRLIPRLLFVAFDSIF